MFANFIWGHCFGPRDLGCSSVMQLRIAVWYQRAGCGHWAPSQTAPSWVRMKSQSLYEFVVWDAACFDLQQLALSVWAVFHRSFVVVVVVTRWISAGCVYLLERTQMFNRIRLDGNEVFPLCSCTLPSPCLVLNNCSSVEFLEAGFLLYVHAILLNLDWVWNWFIWLPGLVQAFSLVRLEEKPNQTKTWGLQLQS